MIEAERGLIVGVDATNLRRGGGRTHLIEVLRAARPEKHGVGRVIVWGAAETLGLLEDREWLVKEHTPAAEGGLLRRALWQRFELSRQAHARGCDLLFVPGGSYAGSFCPVVTMSRNMLPFEWGELRRYGWSSLALKLMLLRWSQSRSFRKSEGVIFLTEYAKKEVSRVAGALTGRVRVIPHGLNSRFRISPRPQRDVSACSVDTPYRLLYVSIVDQYKHQWHVVEAVARLREQTGWLLDLDLVGPAYGPAMKRLRAALDRYDPDGTWARYHGAMPYDTLHTMYDQADLGVFASSCENMPNILLETMAAGLPVACSDRGPMPEVLGDAGVYFDPERPDDIARALRELIASPVLRTEKAQASYTAALAFDWQRCADETFRFLARVAAEHHGRNAGCVES